MPGYADDVSHLEHEEVPPILEHVGGLGEEVDKPDVDELDFGIGAGALADGPAHLEEHRLVPSPRGDLGTRVGVVQPLKVAVNAHVLANLQDVCNRSDKLQALLPTLAVATAVVFIFVVTNRVFGRKVNFCALFVASFSSFS